MKKIVCVLLLALSIPAAAKNVRIALEPTAPLRSKYNFFERTGVSRGEGFIIASSSRGWIVKADDAGKVLWRIKSPCVPSVAAKFDSETVFYPCENGEYRALDLNTGKLKWQFTFNDSVASQPEILADGIIFQTGDGRVYSLNKEDGGIKWLYKSTSRYNLSLRPASRPTVVEDSVFVGMADGNLVVLKTNSGDLIWKKRVFDQPITSDLDFPVFYDDKAVYAASREGVCALSKVSSKNYWCVEEQLAVEPVQDGNSLYALNVGDELLIIDKLAGTIDKRIQIKPSKLFEFEYDRPLGIFINDRKLLVIYSHKLLEIIPPDGKPKVIKNFPQVIQRANFSQGKFFLITSKGYLDIIAI